MPSRKALEIICVDATEQPVERPQKKQRHQYSGKKKCHTQKAQILADMKTGRILSSAFCAGSKHDFQLFKESRIQLPPHVLLLADAGYQGLTGIHPNSQTPVKKTKLHPLDNKQKASNRVLSRKRSVIEHIFCKLKVFRILRERYRNRKKRFGLRFSLIAAVYNMELFSGF